MRKLALTFLTIGYLLLMRIFWQTVSADESYIDSQRNLNVGNIDMALRYANKSIKRNAYEPRYYYGRAKVHLINGSKKNALIDLRKAQDLNTNNLVTLRNLVPLYYLLAVDNSTQTDPNYLNITKDYYQSIKNTSPTDVGIYTLLATYEKKLNLGTNLLESLSNVKRLRPDLLDWYLN